jgi:hypothetical protein
MSRSAWLGVRRCRTGAGSFIPWLFQLSTRAVGRTGGREASCLRFDHRLEGIAVQRPLLLEVDADLGELFRRQG